MYTFVPLNSEGVPQASVVISAEDVQNVRNVLVMALNYNPSTIEFAEAMEPARAVLGVAFEPWLDEVQKIKTERERPECINFIFEDWITQWYIADFVDLRWRIANIESITE